MAYWYDEYAFEHDEGRVYFMMDSDADIENLPTSSREGVKQGTDNVTNEKVSIGSYAYSIESGSKFMLNSNDIWTKLKDPSSGGGGGGGGATNLSDLEDVTLSATVDGDFLVYNSTLGMWTNKKADTVVVDYTNLTDKPTINGIELDGNVTAEELGLENPLTDEQVNALLSLL